PSGWNVGAASLSGHSQSRYFLVDNQPSGRIVSARVMNTKKNPAAAALGALGGKARAENLSAAELSKIGKKGAAARAKKLSAAERRRIAMLGVKARRARKQARKKGAN